LKAGKAELAYQFASTPALDADSGGAFMDAEFLAGWIALQSLHRPELAIIHFDRLAKGVTFPISVGARRITGSAAPRRRWASRRTALVEYRIAAQPLRDLLRPARSREIAANPVLHVNAVASEPSPAERAAFDGG